MMDPKRLPLCAGGVCLLLAAALCWVRLSSFGGADWVGEALRRERIDAEREALNRSTAVTRGILTDLVEGRLSLREAADALRAEHESRPRRLQPPYLVRPDSSVEEDYLRWTCRLAEIHLEDSPRRPQVTRRLREELRACLEGRPARAGETAVRAPADLADSRP
jgi:hypothetical protein